MNASATRPSLVLLDRDGVVIVNRSTNIKHPRDIEFLPRAAKAIARLNAAGFAVAVCTNQPEVSRGAMSEAQLDAVHAALRAKLRDEGAIVDTILCCTDTCKSPLRKPADGMLCEALRRYGVPAADTPFVGDQPDDLKAAFHAGCPRVLVRTGLGRKTLEHGLPEYVEPILVVEDLWEAASLIVEGRHLQGQGLSRTTAFGRKGPS
jgi:D-glycero-D-manno-heptose 1,7-bisphosphate phosphatase